jgi:uncharacterized protein YjbJ (UPF0337 family)
MSTMKSARQDMIGGSIDKVAGSGRAAVGKLTGNRSARAKGKATHGKGVMRSTKGRLKRRGRPTGVLGGLGAVVGGLLGVVGGLLAGVFGLLKGVLTGVGSLLRRLI